MNFISKILAPTDCSEASIDALKYSIKIAKAQRAKVMVLYIISHLKNSAFHSLVNKSAFNSTAHLASKNHLKNFWKSMGENEIEANLTVEYGDPFDEIMRYAQSNKNDIIVMGTHGRTGLMHVLMGSVAEKVVRHSHIPVVTVKHESYEYFPKSGYEYDLNKRY